MLCADHVGSIDAIVELSAVAKYRASQLVLLDSFIAMRIFWLV